MMHIVCLSIETACNDPVKVLLKCLNVCNTLKAFGFLAIVLLACYLNLASPHAQNTPSQ